VRIGGSCRIQLRGMESQLAAVTTGSREARVKRAIVVIALAAGGVYLALGGKGGTGGEAGGVITVVVLPGETSTVLPEELPSQTPVIIVASSTPQPPSTEAPTATSIPESTATNTPQPTATNTPVPTSTNTPLPPPTATKKPAPPKTATPVSLPPPVLMSPDVDFSCYNIGGCNFTWSWGGSLAANQYFQVQLVGPGNEHRGIHPPTKGYSFQSNWTVYQIIRDWCDPTKMCHMQWTVAIIEWDGVDPGKIGRTLAEAAPRWVWL